MKKISESAYQEIVTTKTQETKFTEDKIEIVHQNKIHSKKWKITINIKQVLINKIKPIHHQKHKTTTQ